MYRPPSSDDLRDHGDGTEILLMSFIFIYIFSFSVLECSFPVVHATSAHCHFGPVCNMVQHSFWVGYHPQSF